MSTQKSNPETATNGETKTNSELDLRVDAGTLADFVANARAVAVETVLHIDADGLAMAAVDPSNVAMVTQTLPAAAFDSFEVPDGDETGDGDDEGMAIGVALEPLADRLGMIDAEARVRYDIDRKKLVLTGDGLRFDDGTIDPQSIRSEPDIPDFDLPATVRLDAARFRRGIKAADLVGDHVAIGATAGLGAFWMTGDGDTSDARDALEGDELGEGSKIEADAESLFSIDYLKAIARTPAFDGEVTLRFGTEIPMDIDTDTGETGGCEARFVVAPRIQT